MAERTQYAPGDPRLHDLDPNFSPVLVPRVDEDGRWVVRCPYCHRDSTHSAEVGFRYSHCRCDGMTAANRMGGYVLAPPGALHAPYGDQCPQCVSYFARIDEDQLNERWRRLAVFTPVNLEGVGRSVTGDYVCYHSHTWVCSWADDPAGRFPKPSGPVKRCALYRHFDEFGTLLYVGISETPVGRGKDHARHSAWVEFATRIEATWLPSRQDAERAEKRAIRTELPIFNVTHAIGDSDARMAEYVSGRGA